MTRFPPWLVGAALTLAGLAIARSLRGRATRLAPWLGAGRTRPERDPVRSPILKAVIFDVDGTLVESVDLHARAWVDAFQEFGVPVRFAAVRGQIGKGADQLMPVFLSDKHLNAVGKRLQARRSTIMKDRYLPQVTALPGARALLQRVCNGGMTVALASSASKSELQTYKRIARIADLVEVETSSSDAKRSKPHPDIFSTALAKLRGVRPGEAIAVGDTPYDAEAAAKAGLRTIGLLSGGWSGADLRRAGCIAVYRDPADLLEKFDASPLGRNGGPR